MAQPKPAILIVEREPELSALAADIRSRFGGDFTVVTGATAEAGLEALQSLTSRSQPVALVFAGDAGREGAGVDVLTHAQRLHPFAKRILLVDRNYSPTNPVVRAMMLGQVDYHLSKPWRRERTLYPAVADFLADWAASQESASGSIFRVVGAVDDARCHEIRDALARGGLPSTFHSAHSEVGKQLLSEHGISDARLPVVIGYDGHVMVDPSHAQLLEVLGMRVHPGSTECDVLVLGGGPAGLAAGVYAASEGLETIVLEAVSTGGQAGTSALIRNYLGFAHGISGVDFAVQACEQAWLFGADLVLSHAATSLTVRGADRVVGISDGSAIHARAVVIATGVSWRRLGVPRLEELVGAGVFYGAAGSEARAMTGQHVFLVGAGNSAGQAALNLAKYAASVTVLMRGHSLATSMSEYLIREMAQTPNIHVRPGIEVVDGSGARRLESLVLQDRYTGRTETVAAAALFVMIGAEPRTDWLPPSILRDASGYIRTGRELRSGGDRTSPWPLEREPFPLECSVPGVFAAGDVRSRSVKRVASAVGEGSTAIQMVHEYFREPTEARLGAGAALVGADG